MLESGIDKEMGPEEEGRVGELRDYQNEMAVALQQIFTYPEQVKVEWCAVSRGKASYFIHGNSGLEMYRPAVDIAVGPFAVEQSCEHEYDRLLTASEHLIYSLVSFYDQNAGLHLRGLDPPSAEHLKHQNPNARCFLAIEIERRNDDLKYLMGSALNASALGRIGILIGWDHRKLVDLLKLAEYLRFLAARSKNVFSPGNLIVIEREQFRQAVVETAHL